MHQQEASATGAGQDGDIYRQFDVDPRITYPSYMPMDAFMDVERLRSMDGYIETRIMRRTEESAGDTSFFTGPYKLEADALGLPGTRMFYLSRTVVRPTRLDQTELRRPAEAAKKFSVLMNFIGRIPFKATDRMLIMYDTEVRPLSAHSETRY